MCNRNSRYDKAWSKFITELKKTGLLTWRLFKSADVPLLLKAIPIIAILYWFNPFDFMPAPFLGITPLDDIAVILLGNKLFVEVAPQDVVKRLRDEINYGTLLDDDDQVIDTTYHLMDDDQ